jgi:hypothetical protein
LKLRQIILDGQTLQEKRSTLDDLSFQRRLNELRGRLRNLLAWKSPNVILADAIARVRGQENHILTFVGYSAGEHHNNYGEYIIKKGVLKRKVSCGSKSVKGVRPMPLYNPLP